MEPKAPADQREQVMEADMGFGIPSGLGHRDQAIRIKGVGDQDDETKEAKQRRGRAGNGRCAPLALCFDAKVGAAFFKGHLKRPAFDEGADDGRCWCVRIGGKKGAQGALARRVAHQDPANGQRRGAGLLTNNYAESAVCHVVPTSFRY